MGELLDFNAFAELPQLARHIFEHLKEQSTDLLSLNNFFAPRFGYARDTQHLAKLLVNDCRQSDYLVDLLLLHNLVP